MSFLSIPSQEGLFTTVKTGRSTEEGHFNPVDDDDEDEDDTDHVRFIPRCSPVPRKRGRSILDETEEYLRIQSSLPSAHRRVSFADTTGGDLVDVKEFVAFDSDEEDDARWELEQARYRKPQREPTYQVHPEFNNPTDSVLTQAVHANKVEVEQLTPVEDEPLAFSGIIRVLNMSFHKAVYIRSTMDSWATYFDFPADYVQGSHDGKTDKFSFKLSFAPPYLDHGSRIEFVVRYETSDGDYWANNSHMNYVVTLLLSFEEELTQATGMRDIRGILKPPKVYSADYDFDDEDSQDEDEEAGTSKAKPLRPTPAFPIMVNPEIDIEAKEDQPCPPFAPNPDLPSVDGTLSTTIVSKNNDEDLSFAPQAGEPLQPAESEPLPKLHCELGNQTLEQSSDSSLGRELPIQVKTPTTQKSLDDTAARAIENQLDLPEETKPRLDRSEAEGEEIPGSVASCVWLPYTATHIGPTGEDRVSHSLASHPYAELPSDSASFPPVASLHFKQGVALGELAAVPSVDSTSSAQHDENITAHFTPIVESQISLGAESRASPPPALTLTDNISVENEEQDSLQASPDTLFENPPNDLPEATKSLTARHRRDVWRTLIPSIVFLCAAIFFSIVLHDLSALFFVGLFFVSLCF